MLVDLEGLEASDVYHLMTQVVVPRPIAWVVTDNGDGPSEADRWNLAPYSYFNAVSSRPPMVMFSVGRSPRGPEDGGPVKDTLANLRVHPDLTIALPHRALLDAVEGTSAPVPPGHSELTAAGLTAVTWDWPVPKPSGVRTALGCTVDTVLPVAGGPQHLVLARVARIWVDDAAVGTDAKGRTVVDPVALDPLVRLGAGWYGALGTPARPSTATNVGA